MREDFMKLEDVTTKDPENSGNKPYSQRSGKRLLWFLVIPTVLAASAFFGIQARQLRSQQLAATTKSLEVHQVTLIHPQPPHSTPHLTSPRLIQPSSHHP